jgi:enoyl-[acyl-carrier protein] reductase II
MAGQSVGMVTREQPTNQILAELVAQAEATVERRRRQLADGDTAVPDRVPVATLGAAD